MSRTSIGWLLAGVFTAPGLFSVECAQAAPQTEWRIEDCKIDETLLKRGEVQTCEKSFHVDGEKGEKKGVMGVLLIDAPYNTVWKVISDWEAQSRFVPGLEYFKVRHRFAGGDNTTWHSLVEGKLDIPFVAFRYTLDARFDKRVGKMTWQMLSPDEIRRYQSEKIPVQLSDEDRLKNVEGFAQITALDDQHTIYYYAPVVETSIAVPDFIHSAIMSVSLNDYLASIKAASEKRAKR